ncbi:MAG: ABC transporter permease [Bacteroidales bacterium]|nr:ABC transporter permease [Bacteroidales bacterium]
MYLQRYIHNFSIAIEAVFSNKIRSMLTALGIIFGVAAVIAMLAIGNGARQEILEQMKQVGARNIVIMPILEEDVEDEEQPTVQTKRYSPGLSLYDAHAIELIVPTVRMISPEIVHSTQLIKDGIQRKANVVGINNVFFEIYNLKITNGQVFNADHINKGEPVCIIGHTIKTTFFGNDDPIGQHIKCGKNWLKVIGVIEDRNISESVGENFGISNYNNSVYAPVQTVLRRFIDRSNITSASMVTNSQGENTSTEPKNPNQIDRIVVQVTETEQLTNTSDIIKRLLLRRHNQNEDFVIKIPELLLKQEQRTKDIFNIVLGAIASISLIVGGIGIMNIMLASVMERTKEIGIRLAIGATKKDIVLQFLTEATLISLTGGIIGIFLGILISVLIMKFTSILTIISGLSILLSFGVSVSVGIIFGLMPARKAAQSDPVTSLRYE